MMNAYGSYTLLEAIGRKKNLKILLAHLVVECQGILRHGANRQHEPLYETRHRIRQDGNGVRHTVNGDVSIS